VKFALDVRPEEVERRRILTDHVLKVVLGADIVVLIFLALYRFYLAAGMRSAPASLHLLIYTCIAAVGILLTMLALNRIRSIPYWLSSTIFIFVLIFLGLVSDTPQQILNGPSTVFFVIPILLAGVLIHSYATYFFTAFITFVFFVYALITDPSYFNPILIILFYVIAIIMGMIMRHLEKSNISLRYEADQSQAILSALRSGFVLLDANNHILRMNDAACTMLPGVSSGDDIFGIVQSFDTQADGENLKKLSTVLSGAEGEAQIKLAGKYYFITNKSIRSSDSHLIFLRENTAEFELARLKDTTLAMVSHELRTPLAAIRGHAELAIRQPATAVDNATRILLNTQRLMGMVENILSQTRLRTGKIKNSPAPTEVAGVLKMVASVLAVEAKEKQLTFTWNMEQDLPPVVMIDELLLQQILTNLASNAIKFTPPNGKVTLTASRPDDAHWRVSVKDTGMGIPAAERAEIFNEFFQAHQNTSIYDRPYQGTGLGLSIVKGLSDQMNGKLSLESTEGEGSEFSITFPLILPGGATLPLKPKRVMK
jgi:signal transduction histidine kinase